MEVAETTHAEPAGWNRVLSARAAAWIAAVLIAAGLLLGLSLWLARVHLVWTPPPVGVLIVRKEKPSLRDTYVSVETWKERDFARRPALATALKKAGILHLLAAHEWEKAGARAPRLHDFENRLVRVLFWLLLACTALYLMNLGIRARWLGVAASSSAAASFAILSLILVVRAVDSRHAPFSNLYEFLFAFAWSIMAIYLALEKVGLRSGIPGRAGPMPGPASGPGRAGNARLAGGFVAPVALGLVAYAGSLPESWSEVQRLMPALESPWRKYHIFTGVASYGAAAVAFGMAAAYLLQAALSRGDDSRAVRWLPSLEAADRMMHQAMRVALPFFTLLLITGAIWGKQAWGRYWGWDPKETAAFVTWLIYLVYFHVRMRSGRAGWLPALIAILGFCSVSFTLFGLNMLSQYAQTLHSYATSQR
jgi:cytochrome c-type biogenesis protein CcsB